ncbi:MAG TPA: DUF5602 domain-containing protein [Gemmatimonadaceae bacterium]|nr:DUF5602 domain-containing protein [Gemmatimonadaceae bacterium]
MHPLPTPSARPPARAARRIARFSLPLRVAAMVVAVALASHACTDGAAAPRAGTPAAGRAADPGVHRQYGTPMRVGNGRARTYIVLDQTAGGRPLEVGVALDEAALEGLSTPAAAAAGGSGPHAHAGTAIFDLELPARHGTQYRFVQLDWNPGGHEPPGVYDVPHFDFHFYTISKAERDSIDVSVLGEAEYAARASSLPPEEERTATYVPLSPPGGPVASVPRMGVHWGSLNAPELQGVFGHPEAARPFTTTFLRGSWNGRVTFDEPIVTRAFILGRRAATAPAQRDSVIPLPSAQRYRPAGHYPAAYRVAYDAQAKEYRIALVQLTRRD